MRDDERDLDELSEAEADLARRLIDLGGVIGDIDSGVRNLDATFARTLRAHLLHGEDLAPHPSFARRLRQRLFSRPGARPLPRPRAHRWRWFTPLPVLLAVIVSLVVQRSPGQGFHTPIVTTNDLLINLGSSSTITSGLSPTVSSVHQSLARAYAGPVRVHVRSLPHVQVLDHAYQLGSVRGVVATGRVLLGIHAPVHRTVTEGATWLVAVDGGTSSRHPLHSLAASLTTGEVIYHDQRNFRLPHAHAALDRDEAVDVARRWLTRLGWPGRSMPVRSAELLSGMPAVRAVVFGWAGVGPSTIEQAILWVAPDHSVIEASLWPPVAQSGNVTIRTAQQALHAVTSRHVPLVIDHVSPSDRRAAIAEVRHVISVLVLIPGRHGTPYLVPAYRFEGSARVGTTARKHPWLSLVPLISR
jgi:hypothetical protein